MSKVKQWKVTVEGTFFSSAKDAIEEDYSVKGTIPHCEKEYVLSFLKARYLKDWIKEATGKTPATVYRYELVNEPSEVEVDIKESVFGRSIDDMDWSELQDMATEYTLLEIPATRKGTISNAKMIAKKAYLKQIKKIDISEDSDEEIMSIKIKCAEEDKSNAPVRTKRSLADRIKAVEEEEFQKVDLTGSEPEIIK